MRRVLYSELHAGQKKLGGSGGRALAAMLSEPGVRAAPPPRCLLRGGGLRTWNGPARRVKVVKDPCGASFTVILNISLNLTLCHGARTHRKANGATADARSCQIKGPCTRLRATAYGLTLKPYLEPPTASAFLFL